jgi:hypothetical protein
LDLLSLFHNRESGSFLFDVMLLGADGSSGGFEHMRYRMVCHSQHMVVDGYDGGHLRGPMYKHK